MLGTWAVIFPPLLVIISVLLTKRMLPSFMVGLISSALIATDGNIGQAGLLIIQKLWTSTGLGNITSFSAFLSSWNLLIFIFLITLGILIALLRQTGAAQAYVRVVRTKVTNKKAAQIASLILSLFFFIDDYFSALTVGSVMRPLAQLYAVHPVKLAFLVTAMATPITILSPISSWVGEIILQLKQIGIGPSGPATIIVADPYMVLLHAIPFMFYALLLIISTWYIVLRGISYGPMHNYDLSTASEPISAKEFQAEEQGSLFDFVFPLALLIMGVFCTLLYTGGFFLFGGTNGFAQAIKSGSVHQSLFVGGIVSLVVSIIYFLAQKTLSISSLLACVKTGFSLMFPSILMLICAWSLGAVLKNDLQTGSYIASIVSSFIQLKFFPVICFVFAGLIATMIGSAWATIGLMFPIVLDMLQKLLHLQANTAYESVPLLLPIIGATLSGCIIGTQLSIISDNPIMSSASTGANHLEHVKTMAWYVIPVGIGAASAYILLGITSSALGSNTAFLVSLIAGIGLSIILLELGQRLFGKTKVR